MIAAATEFRIFYFNRNMRVPIVLGMVAAGGLGAWWIYRRLSKATSLNAAKEDFTNIEHLYTTIESLRKEIEELKNARQRHESGRDVDDTDNTLSSRKKTVRFKKTHSIISCDASVSESEYMSAWSGSEYSDDEFFDFSDVEADIIPNETESALSSHVGGLDEEVLQIFDRADTLLEGEPEDHIEAYNLLLTHRAECSGNAEFLWRLAKACRMAAVAFGSQGSEDKKKEMLYQAAEYGKAALDCDDNSAEAHKWYAVCLGSLSDYLAVSDKIKNGFIFKEHIDRAIQINPKDAILHHLIGRFCYEVSMLSWVERKVAATLFSSPPTATVQESLAHFLNAEKLQTKPWKENRLFIAQCYIKESNYSEAIKWIDLAVDTAGVTPEDQAAHPQLLTLQRRYGSYRR